MVRTNRRIAILASAASLLAVVFSGVAQASDHHDSGYSDDTGSSADDDSSADSGRSADDASDDNGNNNDNNDDDNAHGGVGGKAGENSNDCGLALKRGAGQHCHTVPAHRGEDGPDEETY